MKTFATLLTLIVLIAALRADEVMPANEEELAVWNRIYTQHLAEKEITPEELTGEMMLAIQKDYSVEVNMMELKPDMMGGGGMDSGGGDVIVSPDGFQLLDLMEKESFCMECLPAFTSEVRPRLVKIEEAYFSLHQQFHKRSSTDILYLHNMLAESIEEMNWYFVDYKLPNIADEGKIRAYFSENKKQLAIQVGSDVFIDRNLFNELDQRNRGALFLHEMILNICLRQGVSLVEYGTSKIRTVVNLLFMNDFQTLSSGKIIKKVRDIGIRDMQRAGVDMRSMKGMAVYAALSTDEALSSEMNAFFEKTNSDMEKILAPLDNIGIMPITNDRQKIKREIKKYLAEALDDYAAQIPATTMKLLEKINSDNFDDRTLGSYKYKYTQNVVELTTANNRRAWHKKWSRVKIKAEASRIASLSVALDFIKDIVEEIEQREKTFEHFIEIYLN